MKLKILTTNIWRYYEWEKRKEKLIRFLKEQDADIVFMQEVAHDGRLKDKWNNQAEEINEKANYPHFSFGKLMEMEKWHGEPINWEMYYGFGILSKYPIKSSEVIVLPPVEKNKKFGFMHAVLEFPEGEIHLINVHLENTNKGSKKHLKQTLEWCKKRKIFPIIAGDFNMKIIKDLKEVAGEDYEISYLLKEYKSFMPTDFSHNKEAITLDYIISNKNLFKMKNVNCIENDVSDHNPVIAELEIK